MYSEGNAPSSHTQTKFNYTPQYTGSVHRSQTFPEACMNSL